MTAARQQGVALVLVLWLTTLLAVMASAFALSTQRESTLVKGARDRAEALALAEGAIHYAMVRLSASNPQWRWQADGAVYELGYGGGRVRIQLLDEAGKVDLNSAQQGLLQALFVAAGLTADQASGMADAILDWRDGDEVRRLQGAETEDYRLAGRNFGPRNKPFQAVEELQTVLGMTPDLYERIESWVTVYSRRAGLDPRSAPPALLRGLPGLDQNAVEAYLQARSQSAAVGGGAPQSPLPALSGTQAIPLTSGGQSAVGVRAEAMLANGGTAAVSAVLGRGGLQPYKLLHWREQKEAGPSLFRLPVAASVLLEAPRQ